MAGIHHIVVLLSLSLTSPWAVSQNTFQKLILNSGNPGGRNAQPSIDDGVTFCCWVENRFGASGKDIMMVSMNDLGDTVWTKVYGRGYDDRSYQLVRTSDNGYLIVGTSDVSATSNSYHVLLIRTDALGDTLWTKAYQWLESGLYAVEGLDGGFLLVGNPNGGLYMIRVSDQGDVLWSSYYDRQDPPDFQSGISASSVAQGADGNFFVVGRKGYSSGFLSKIDPTGLVQWTKEATWGSGVVFKRIIRTIDDGFIILGGSTQNYFVVKIDALGEWVWTKAYDTPSGGWAREVSITSDGGFAMTGGTNAPSGPTDNIYLLKLSSEGDLVFSHSFGDTGWKVGQGVVEAPDGGLFVVAAVVNSGSPYSSYVIKTDSNGFGECDQYDIETTTQDVELVWSNLQLQSFPFTATEQAVALMISSGATLTPLCPVGFNEGLASSIPIQVSPNPANDRFTVTVPPNFAQGEIEFFNAFGARLLKGKVTSSQTTIGCSSLSRGIYWIKVTSATWVASQRIVLE